MLDKDIERKLDWWVSELKEFDIDHEPYSNVYCCKLSETQVVWLRNLLMTIQDKMFGENA